jgi:hypothetical protein
MQLKNIKQRLHINGGKLTIQLPNFMEG